jgi:hypothetical protein
MSRNVCRYWPCDEEPLDEDAPAGVRSSFCSRQCELRFEHIRDDARDARMTEGRR